METITKKAMYVLSYATIGIFIFGCGVENQESKNMVEDEKMVSFMNVDPGHFHAALVQKNMYEKVSPKVYVYAPEGPEVENYLGAINAYNSRTDGPTSWTLEKYLGVDFFEKMIAEKPGNVMVVSGNNAKKTEYIHKAIDNGIHVLADKPMVIQPDEFAMLQEAFKTAAEKDVLLYDIMTERFEVTTTLQKAFSQFEGVFGTLESGTPEDPAITKESVHHYSKLVSGKPIKRPPWFFDVTQQGEGVVDVSTHLVDLVFWECYPEQIIDYTRDLEIAGARRWATKLTPSHFAKVTQLASYPAYLHPYVTADSILEVFANGEITFKVKETYAKVSVIWNFEAPEGAGDTHYSIMRGTKANLVIRQGADQDYKPTLYIEPIENKASITVPLEQALSDLGTDYQGLSITENDAGWQVNIPDRYKVGHEAHFAQVTERFLEYLEAGKLPDWEVPNMIAKYYVTTEGYKASR